MTEVGETLQEVLATAYDKIEKSHNEKQRLDACEEARDRMRSEAKKFQKPKETFLEAEQLCRDGSDEEQEAHDKAKQCDDLMNQVLETLEGKLNDALASAGDNDDLSDEEDPITQMDLEELGLLSPMGDDEE